jgi:hypothetical protein
MAKQWADQLVAMGKPIEDDDLISLIISGLHLMFNSFITVVKKKKKTFITAFSFVVRDR